jgi:predicted TPR repeat methyltransferase
MKKFQKIINQYNAAFYKANNEFEMARWSNHFSMVNRYIFFFKNLENKEYKKWIDIGSGTGKIFELAKKTKIIFKKSYGIDLNKNLVKFAKNKSSLKDINLSEKNFLHCSSKRKYNLLSAIGILQNCGINYKVFLQKVYDNLQNKGEFFITFKSSDWHKLKNKRFIKEKDLIRHDPNLIIKATKKKFSIIANGGIDLKKKSICSSKITGEYFIYGKKK